MYRGRESMLLAGRTRPGARDSAVSWIDTSGNLWLFGGDNIFEGGGKFNDLWEYQAGSSTGNPPPPPPTTYTIGGTTSGLSGSGLVLQDDTADNLTVTADGSFVFATPIPSGSTYAVTILTQPTSPAQYCVVTNGSGTANANVANIQITCSTITPGHNQWTWVSGAESIGGAGVYGTLGTASLSNVPGARIDAVSWSDSAGNLWMFGGNVGLISNELIGPSGQLDVTYFDFSDLWKFSKGEWTWMGGANTSTSRQPGVYGTLGTASPGNLPGARHSASSWTDASGNFWLFGGIGVDSTGAQGDLNDLWKYSAGQWTWIAGSELANQPGSYGTQGTPAPGNTPGARNGAVSWTDLSGTLWLFGGFGYDSTGKAC